MFRKLLFLVVVTLVITPLWFIGCNQETPMDAGQQESVSDPPGNEENPSLICSPSDWPKSMSDFKFPFSGVYNDFWHGEIWKITCGYFCGKHKYTSYPSAGKYSIDLVRDDGGSTIGSYVLAPARGIVAFADWMEGYGWCVVMDHDTDGNAKKGYRSIVAHLNCDPKRFTNVGHDLLQGTLIGIAGKSASKYGDTTPHIHFSVWKDDASVPLNGISGTTSLVEGGRYCSGNAFIPSPTGKTSCP